MLRDLKWTIENDAFDVLWVAKPPGHFEQLYSLFAEPKRCLDFKKLVEDTFKTGIRPSKEEKKEENKDLVDAALDFCPLYQRSKAAFIVPLPTHTFWLQLLTAFVHILNAGRILV